RPSSPVPSNLPSPGEEGDKEDRSNRALPLRGPRHDPVAKTAAALSGLEGDHGSVFLGLTPQAARYRPFGTFWRSSRRGSFLAQADSCLGLGYHGLALRKIPSVERRCRGGERTLPRRRERDFGPR